MAFYDEPQWAVVGDTFPVGCKWSENIVYRNETYHDNPDGNNPQYNTKCGMYEEKCGIENLMMSWGHDVSLLYWKKITIISSLIITSTRLQEYLYRVLKHNKCKLPKEAFQIIRYHSFYPWHTAGDYQHFEIESDENIKKWVNIFKYVSNWFHNSFFHIPFNNAQ